MGTNVLKQNSRVCKHKNTPHMHPHIETTAKMGNKHVCVRSEITDEFFVRDQKERQ